MKNWISERQRLLQASVIGYVLMAFTANAAPDFGVGFDRDDFLISSLVTSDAGIYVLDADLTLKGWLLNSPLDYATGLDFDAQGRLVARESPFFKRGALAGVYEPSGRLAPETQFFSLGNSGITLDLKVSQSDTYLAAKFSLFPGEDIPNGLLEIDRQGNLLRTFDDALPSYMSVAVLGDGTIWAGAGVTSGFLNAFDPVTGDKSELFTHVPSGRRPPLSPAAFDGGQVVASSMTYDATTDTVLIADRVSKRVFERATDGSLLNTFVLPGLSEGTLDQLIGVTRGPRGEVFAAYGSTIYRFAVDGTFLDETTLDLDIGAVNLVWAGNAPLFNAVPGDFTGDRIVDQLDLDQVLFNWQTDPTESDAIDGFVITAMLYGAVDDGELQAVLDGWTSEVAPDFRGLSIPEPSVALLMVLSWFMTRRRRGEWRS